MSETGKSSADSFSSSTFGQCTDPRFDSGSTSAHASARYSGFGASPTPPFGGKTSNEPPPFGTHYVPPPFRKTSYEPPPFGTSTTSFGNPTSNFGASLAPTSGSKSSADSCASSTFGQGFGTSSSPPEITSTFRFASPAPALGGSVASTPLFGRSSSSGFCACPTPTFGAAFGASSSTFGTSISSGYCSSPGFVTPTASFGNSTPAFGSSLAPTSGGFLTAAPSFGSSTASFGASVTPTSGAADSSASHLGNSTFGISAPSSRTFGLSTSTPASLFQDSASGFGHSVLGQNVKGSRIARYTATPESDGDSRKLISICGMKTHSNKSHEELRADDYQLGDKGGIEHASISRDSIDVADIQKNHMAMAAASSNTSLHPHVPLFSNTFSPGLSMTSLAAASSNSTLHPRVPVFQTTISPGSRTGTASNNKWSSAPSMQCQGEKGPFFSQPSVAIASVFPSVPDHRNPFTSNPFDSHTKGGGNPFASHTFASNPFTSQTKGGDNAYSGGISSTGASSSRNFFTPVIPNSSGWQTSPVNAGIQSEGSRSTAYTATLDHPEGKMQSISAMPVYGNKSHEELRSIDYLLGDKGGCKEFLIAKTEASSSQQNPFTSPSTNQFLFSANNSTCSTTQPPANPFLCSSLSSGFPSSSLPSFTPFSSSSSTTTPGISTETSPFLSSNVFQPSQLLPSSLASTPFSSVGSGPSFSPSTPSFSFVSSGPSLFSSTPSFPFVSSGPSFSYFSTPSSLVSSEPSFPPPSTSFSFMSSTSSSGTSGTTSFVTSTDSRPLQSSQLFAPLDRHTSPFIGSQTTPTPISQNTSNSVTLPPVLQTISSSVPPTVEQQSVTANPSVALNMTETSVRQPGTILSVQYGISSRPVTDKSSPARRTSLLSVKHVSIGLNRLRLGKCNAKSDVPKVAFFTEGCGTVKADPSIIPRNNPGCWISSPSKESVPEADSSQVSRSPRKTNSSSEDKMSGSAKDVKIVDNLQGHNENLEELLPKLMAADYYTEPSISELAAKEKAEPGFCSRVKDFVVGRVGYGSIKFLGETDTRKLELGSIIKFNHRELLVYFNENMEMPPVGQGLNKPAEITLLEVKCIGTKNGNQYIDGPKVEKCRERLIKKTAELGAEFVSYNPVLGEWKFKVQHF